METVAPGDSRVRFLVTANNYAHTDHRPDRAEETLSTFDSLHREGRVRSIGCSYYRAWRIEEARELSRFRGFASHCCVRQRHTYLRPAPGRKRSSRRIWEPSR